MIRASGIRRLANRLYGASKLFVLPALLIANLNFQAHAQQDADVVRVNTDLVILNITATDKRGEYVSTLRLPDFKIYEDGKEVEAAGIKGFAVQESAFASVVLL